MVFILCGVHYPALLCCRARRSRLLTFIVVHRRSHGGSRKYGGSSESNKNHPTCSTESYRPTSQMRCTEVPVLSFFFKEGSNISRIKQGFAQPSSRSSVPSQQWHRPLQSSAEGFCAGLALLLLSERAHFRLSLPPIPPTPPTANDETSQLSSCFGMVRVNGMVRALASPAGVTFRSP